MSALPTWMSSVSQPAAANGANACFSSISVFPPLRGLTRHHLEAEMMIWFEGLFRTVGACGANIVTTSPRAFFKAHRRKKPKQSAATAISFDCPGPTRWDLREA